jgi:membrane-associated phospholipid phosphatase
MIPLVPEFYWIYILYYPLCFSPIALLKDIHTFRKVALSFALQFGISFIIFILVPVRMVQAEILSTTLSARALKGLYDFDPGFNVFPSLHVANLVMIVFIFYEYSKFWARVLLFLTILISMSTMFVKQHYFVDVLFGTFLGWFVYYIVFQKDLINLILKECKNEAE